VAIFSCVLLFLSGLTVLVRERNRYNVVSYGELLKIRDKLKVLSPQEKQDLAFFIHEVTSSDQYSYALVGYKPMSLSNVIVEDSGDLPVFYREDFQKPRYQTLRRGYLAWEKYETLFPRKKHILINYPFLGKGRREIALICPKLCKSLVLEHLADFRDILGKPYTSEEVFWILTHPEHRDFYSIMDRTRLVGILLGFGRNNAWLYERYRGGKSRCILERQLAEQDPLQMFSDEWPWPGAQLSPNFACDLSTDETQHLKKHYKEAKRVVWWTYFLRNNLEVTLALLTQN
jgi:hypothetical protein